ncbi:hypothetical protein FEM48_Zijuj05G0037500 [Ziziphus jujuba var. spinosa]|uniref:non-specific serine/threonine protein kinase n=1 Tax=Ziziphus jujuba var. spinosa TaxID=714518 RepID=A0A978VCM5_ZIZJJ|nr:hypothetical protein FEM48_Zijuj05G0037500 [Ziziphus jujuba var. spinosa]
MAGISLDFDVTFYAAASILFFASFTGAQNQTQPTTDPSEGGCVCVCVCICLCLCLSLSFLCVYVVGYKIPLQVVLLKADTQKWNISGEPCSGAAIDQTSISSADYNSFIKCNCSYNNGSLCHIVQLKVTEIDIIGPIPEDLWTLIHLSYLDVSKNYLTGNLSRSIGNLTRLQYLNVAVNALKGELPKELGNLTELLSLSIADNYFSGHLPPELGNLSNLQKLYIQSSGVNGEIPSTFANLQSLDTLWASDSELAGKIPDFIGNWSKLKILRLQGNSFEGSIPMAFGNLTSLSELRVSDLTNGSSSLEFIKSLKNLSVLELRNNNISDSFPSNIGEYQKLKELDLSFNNISGEIPNSLFNLSSISMLFLGNNKMSGALPQEKIASLRVVDLSYNNLGGEVPSWVNQQKLQLNLVGNNFTATSLNSSGLPSGLECLQQNFPCDRGRGTHYSFAINCGGEQFTSADRIVYERDNNTLGPATYYVSDTNRWAVSIVGFFTGINNARYTVDSSYQFTNTLDSELFQTSRLSASSLRYYGLRLENGEYTVNLQFAETVFEDSTNWKNLGRRVFDVYIQGIRVLQNFDIRKESGWVTSQAIRMEFKAQVSENYLEIHLFWAGKGTTSIPTEGTYGPSIAAISITPDFEPTVNNIPRTSKKKKTGLITGIVVGGGLLSFLSIFIIFYLVQKENDSQTNDDIELLGMDVRPFTFSYDKLKMATNDFSSANVLGEGGYGSVYKGKLQDGRVIAAKQLSLTSHQGKDQFVAEIATMTAVQHRNLVQLYGCCHEGNNLILVYEYMANNSLEHVWKLYKEGRELEVVDSAITLSESNEEQIRRVIRIALLCTQTSPSLRPTMSRVVAMLLGDVQVTNEITTPGFLSDRKFNRLISSISDISLKGNFTSFYNSSAGTSMVSTAGQSVINANQYPMFQDSIREGAQNQTQPTTDPSEVKALNSLFEHWKIKADTQQWNISGEPCSGDAIDQTSISSADYNPFIKCNCSYNNGSLCHIVQLKVTEIDIIGPIPEDLWTLTHLSYLDVSKNYLTGNLSRSIGNLTQLQNLTVAINALKGELPKELGNLTELLSLSIADNYFSGHLPSELGNLSNLQKLYIQSSGVSGEIPSTFANLQSLDTLWASDTELAGKIPDFIGNWSKLKILRLQGNSFEGSMPLAFGNLTSLSELRVSDLTNGSSSLEFIKSLKNLSVLELRNNNISDSFPSNIGEYQKLKELDLSFNNISGEIPNSLFNMSSLSMLFLGNNKMSGALPKEKIASLSVLDLSYNNLAGEVPSWVNQQNLQLNLVGNNFTAASLNSSGLPSGLECLRQNFPCDRGRGTYNSFAVNCGGEQFTSASRIVYESDNNTLGPATYYVSDSNRWAVSIVGFFTGIINARYIVDSAYQFTNTLDSELFQTSRLSASSLRYYGLGLENGEYTVNLQFAETVFQDSITWKNLGRRVFDVYIQGIRVLQNFDIRKESGWVTSQAVLKEFKARVSENYLEIHLFWAGKGTTSIPSEGTYGPSIAAISVTPDFEPTLNNIAHTSKQNKTGLITGILVGGGVLSFLSIFIIFYLVQKENDSQTNDDIDLLGIDVRPFTFSYDQLKMATNDFSSANMLGEGGYGSVYKGKLQDGRVIAAKQLSLTSHQGKDQFVAEIATMTAVQHRNLVQLYGCCHEGNNRILVYEYMENNSLDHVLFGDVQVTNEITTPGYLSDRKFDRLISSTSDIATKGTFTSFYNSSAGTSMVRDAGQSVINANQYPMFQDSIRDGR